MDWEQQYYKKFYYDKMFCGYCGKGLGGKVITIGGNRFCSQVCQSKAADKAQMLEPDSTDKDLDNAERLKKAQEARIMAAIRSKPNLKNIYGDRVDIDSQAIKQDKESWTFEGH